MKHIQNVIMKIFKSQIYKENIYTNYIEVNYSSN